MSSDATDLRDRAAELLITPAALAQLSAADAAKVVNYMRPRWFPAGHVVMEEGDAKDSDLMLLVIDGELSVESHQMAVDEDWVVRLMGPGSLIGEMSLLDGAPRSASCVAHTDLVAAELRRHEFQRLIQEQPDVGARLLWAIATRLSVHLRDATRRLKLLTTMNRALSRSLATDDDPANDDAT